MLHKGSQQNWYSGLVMRESVQLHSDVQGSGLDTVSSRNLGCWESVCVTAASTSVSLLLTQNRTPVLLGGRSKIMTLMSSPVLQDFDLAVH